MALTDLWVRTQGRNERCCRQHKEPRGNREPEAYRTVKCSVCPSTADAVTFSQHTFLSTESHCGVLYHCQDRSEQLFETAIQEEGFRESFVIISYVRTDRTFVSLLTFWVNSMDHQPENPTWNAVWYFVNNTPCVCSCSLITWFFSLWNILSLWPKPVRRQRCFGLNPDYTCIFLSCSGNPVSI